MTAYMIRKLLAWLVPVLLTALAGYLETIQSTVPPPWPSIIGVVLAVLTALRLHPHGVSGPVDPKIEQKQQAARAAKAAKAAARNEETAPVDAVEVPVEDLSPEEQAEIERLRTQQ